MTNQSSVLITVKLVIPTESRGMFQTYAWLVREPSFAALCEKVHGKIRNGTAQVRLFWWDKQTYREFLNDQSFQQAIQEWFDNSIANPSIYVTVDHDQPEKTYGNVPYDLDTASVHLKRRKHHRLKHFRLHRSKSRSSRVSTMCVPETTPTMGGNYIQCGTSDSLNPVGGVAYATHGLMMEPTVCHPVPAVQPSVSIPPPATSSPLSYVQEVEAEEQGSDDDEEEEEVDSLRPAIETLRNMGFEQDEEVLRCCIVQTRGDLNAIIDWLQAHEYS